MAFRTTAATCALGLLLALPAAAQGSGDDVRQEIEALKKGQQEIQKQLAEIKALLQARPAAAAAPAAPPPGPDVKDKEFDLGANPIRGKDTAKLTLIEFSDSQCGYCAQYTRETYPQIAKEYIDTGKVRYVMLDHPLDMHKDAFKAAEAARCAADQGKFDEMHDRLFANARSLEPFKGHAEALGLDVAKFEACMAEGKHAAGIRADLAQAQAAGLRGTPGFILAWTDPARPRKAKAIVYLRGAHPFSSFKTEIDKALAGS
jgi:protein-disulfide isomerase